MKRILILLFIVGLALSLTAKEHGGEHAEGNSFTNYTNDPSFENFHLAVMEFSKMAETNPNGNIMLSYLYQMEMDRNITAVEAQKDSLDMRGKFSYANLLLSLGRNDEAVKIYDSINTEAPKWSCPWRHKGEALYKATRLEEAEVATIKAIEAREDHFDAYVQLAHIQYDMAKKEEALKTLVKGFGYHDEECEEEVIMEDEHFFQLMLLKETGKKAEFKKLSAKLRDKAPESKHWENFK